MTAPFIGMIINAGFNFAPRGYATCDGQIVPISQNTALFALLGTQYGGNGTQTFGLPDLRGQVVLHRGQSGGTSNYVQGQRGGSETTTMTQATMPAHTHATTFAPTANLSASNVNGTTNTPTAGYQLAIALDGDATPDATPYIYVPASATNEVALAATINVAGTVTNAPFGGSTPFALVNPYQSVISCIAMQGVFPTRN